MEDKLKRFKESLKRDMLVTQREEVVANVLTPERLEARNQFLEENTSGKAFFEKANQVISYERMPQGMKEAQERNNVRDHGLKLRHVDPVDPTKEELATKGVTAELLTIEQIEEKYPFIDTSWLKKVKGNFRKIAGVIDFYPCDDGVFSLTDPNNINEATKNFLDRKFPGLGYYGTGQELVYMPKAIVEPELNGYIEALDKQVVEITNDFQVMLPVEPSKSLKLNFGQSKKEEMTEKVEAYKESKARVIARDEVQGFEPEEKTWGEQLDEMIENNPVEIPVPVQEKAKPKFGRARFAKKPLEEGEVAKNKINASKIEEHGIVFDSKIENFMYNLLNEEGIRFEFQKEFILQEGFVYMHENILPVKIIIDFFMLDYPVMADTKGMMMDHTKIKHKMLKKLLHDQGNEYRIVLPSSQKKCRELIHMLRYGFKVEEPLTEHAATQRKNKLKKVGFEWVEGFWCKGEVKYAAIHIMEIPKYDFEELLIKHQ